MKSYQTKNGLKQKLSFHSVDFVGKFLFWGLFWSILLLFSACQTSTQEKTIVIQPPQVSPQIQEWNRELEKVYQPRELEILQFFERKSQIELALSEIDSNQEPNLEKLQAPSGNGTQWVPEPGHAKFELEKVEVLLFFEWKWWELGAILPAGKFPDDMTMQSLEKRQEQGIWEELPSAEAYRNCSVFMQEGVEAKYFLVAGPTQTAFEDNQPPVFLIPNGTAFRRFYLFAAESGELIGQIEILIDERDGFKGQSGSSQKYQELRKAAESIIREKLKGFVAGKFPGIRYPIL